VWPRLPPHHLSLTQADMATAVGVPQVITEFCKEVGADPKTRQRLILMAKKTGGELGFLA
jgi:hypothetical protein